MIKALIVDDESRARNILRILIEKHVPAISHLFLADSAAKALELIAEQNPHILFLDIEMPFMDGFGLLSAIEKRNFDVIFTTAFDQYAIKAIRFSALDYLLKPISPEELKTAVDRFMEKRNLKRENGKLFKNFLTSLDDIATDDPKLAISTQEGVALFKISEIIRCEANNNYTLFFLKDGKRFIASKTLKEYDEILSEYGFFRTHKSHLVNLSFVAHLASGDGVSLQDGTVIEVSRRKKPLLKKKLLAK